MATVIVPTGDQNVRNTIFDYTRVVHDLNNSKPFILSNGNLQMLASPESILPRNYVDESGACTIRYSSQTSYPFEIMAFGEREVKLFPAFTPIAPDPNVSYAIDSYDKTEVYVHSHVPRVEETTTEPTAPAPRTFPQANDYYNTVAPIRSDYQPLELNRSLPTEARRRTQIVEQPTICPNTKRNQVRFEFTQNADEFYAPAESGRPTATLPVSDVLRNYYEFLQRQSTSGSGGAASGSGEESLQNQPREAAPIPQQQTQPLQQQQQPIATTLPSPSAAVFDPTLGTTVFSPPATPYMSFAPEDATFGGFQTVNE